MTFLREENPLRDDRTVNIRPDNSSVTHHAADGLNDVDHRPFEVKECPSASRQATSVMADVQATIEPLFPSQA